jgi:hypothetical protein
MSRVTIGFGQTSPDADFDTVSSVPSDVSTLEVKVYSGSVDISNLVQSFSFDKIDITKDRISVDVIPGGDLLFEVSAKNARGLAIYKGTSTLISLSGGEEQSLTISLQKVVLSLSANLTVSLVDTSGAGYSNPGYLRTVDTIVVEVYKPGYSGGVYDLGTPLSTSTASFSASQTITPITGAKAYPDTYQLVMVKAMTLDGTIAAIGGVGIDSLKEGANSVTSGMTAPGRIKFLTANTAATVKVEMLIGGTYYTVSTKGYPDTDGILVLVPNAMAEFGKGKSAVKDLKIRYTIGAYPVSTYDFLLNYTGAAKTAPALEWKQAEITL